MFIEVGNRTMQGILTGCVGAEPHNSVKPTQLSYNSKSGQSPTLTSAKNVEMILI